MRAEPLRRTALNHPTAPSQSCVEPALSLPNGGASLTRPSSAHPTTRAYSIVVSRAGVPTGPCRTTPSHHPTHPGASLRHPGVRGRDPAATNHPNAPRPPVAPSQTNRSEPPRVAHGEPVRRTESPPPPEPNPDPPLFTLAKGRGKFRRPRRKSVEDPPVEPPCQPTANSTAAWA